MKQKEKNAEIDKRRETLSKRFWEKNSGARRNPFLLHCSTLNSLK